LNMAINKIEKMPRKHKNSTYSKNMVVM